MRRQYLTVLSSLCIGLGLIFVSLISLAARTWPYMKVMVQQWYGSIFATCDCSKTTLLTQQPWFSSFAVLSVVAALSAALWLVVRFIQALAHTRHFEQQLAAQRTSVTYCHGVPVYQIEPAAPLAATVGFRFPAVYVSRTLKQILDPWEYWAVIKHELSHALYRDPLHRFVLYMVRPLLRFFPNLLQHIFALQELAADEAAHDDKALRSALLKLYDYESQAAAPESNRFERAMAGVSYFSVTEARINRLLGQIPAGYSLRRILIILTFVFSALGVANHVMARSDSNLALTACLEQQPVCQAVMHEVQHWPVYYFPIKHSIANDQRQWTVQETEWVLIFD